MALCERALVLLSGRGLTGTMSSSINGDALFNVNSFIYVEPWTGKRPFRRLRRQERDEKARVRLTNEEVCEAVLASA